MFNISSLPNMSRFLRGLDDCLVKWQLKQVMVPHKVWCITNILNLTLMQPNAI